MAKAGKRSTTSRSRTQQKRRKPSAPPTQREPVQHIIGPDEKIYLRPSWHTEGIVKGYRIPKQRRKPKRERSREILRQCFPPDGVPPPEFRPAAIKKTYHDACCRAGIPRKDRYSETQLLRIVGRKKS